VIRLSGFKINPPVIQGDSIKSFRKGEIYYGGASWSYKGINIASIVDKYRVHTSIKSNWKKNCYSQRVLYITITLSKDVSMSFDFITTESELFLGQMEFSAFFFMHRPKSYVRPNFGAIFDHLALILHKIFINMKCWYTIHVLPQKNSSKSD
jgi:hypothetical protein